MTRWLFVVAVLMSGCSGSGDSELVVSAASSLTDAFGDIERAFEDTHDQVDVVLNLGGSSALREQILSGAPVDVFASADAETMAELVAAGEASGSTVIARNRMAIVVPQGNPADIDGLEDLARSDLFVGLCAPTVPCGRLARVILESAGVEPSIDSEEPDVRTLLAKVANGDLDVGIVYVSDLAGNALVDGLDIPVDVNVSNEYHIAVLVNTPQPDLAAEFVKFVTSADGLTILADNGFLAP